MMSSTCFEPERSSSGRRLYIQVWNSMYYMPRLGSLVGPTRLHLIHTIMLNILFLVMVLFKTKYSM